jgi:hypothetical protein
MSLTNGTTWAQLANTAWSFWADTLWSDIGILYANFGGGVEYDSSWNINHASKRTKEAVLRLKFYFQGYPPYEVEKKIKKTKKITVEDVKFVKNQIFIKDIKL